MGMVVRSNIMALNANRQLGMNNTQVGKSLEKLSSGYRINRAGDDASGLAISEKMKAQIKGLETASSNSQDGISLIQTAEGNLTEVHDMLNRMVELAEKSANGTMETPDSPTYGAGGTDRNALQAEMDALSKEIDRIADSANFNNIKLLDGSLTSSGMKNVNTDFAVDDTANTGELDFSGIVIGEDGSYTVDIDGTGTLTATVNLKKNANGEDIAKAVADALTTNGTAGVTADGSKLKFADTATPGVAVGNYKIAIDTATPFKKGDAYNYEFGGVDIADITDGDTLAFGTAGTITFGAGGVAIGATVEETLKNVAAAINADAAAANTYGFDSADFEASVQGTKLILTAKRDGTARPGGMVLTDVDNANAQLAMGAGDKANSGLILQIGDTSETFNKMEVSVDNMHMASLFKGSNIKDEATGNAILQTLDNGTTTLDISAQDTAGAAMTAIKKVINTVSTQRANLGALQNRLEHTINNLDVAAENMSSANSRIRDTDMAKQMMDYTKMNVLTQAAQAMLAQANQQPQSVLQLLQ